ncbi:MAG: hypothetical protein ACK5P6_00020 [Pseudobdellovibrionaceae bacterium]
MKYFLTLALSLLVTQVSFAHEGHDHGAASFQAPKGGILKSIENSHFELVRSGQFVQIYAYDNEGKALATSKFKTSAELQLPRKKKEVLTLNDKGTHWEAQVNSQGAHRFTVKFNTDDGKEKDYVSFTVETK